MRLVAVFFLVLAHATAAPAVELSGHVELDLESEHNFDLDHSTPDTLTLIAPEFQLELTHAPIADVKVYLQAELKRKFELVEEGEDKDRSWSLELEEAWAEFQLGAPELSLRIGRQDFEDYREWLYDQELDGFRLFHRIADLDLELAAVRDRALHMDFLEERDVGEFDFLQAMAIYSPHKKLRLTAYGMKQAGRNGNQANPWWIGLRSYGNLAESWRHWTEIAILRGEDEDTPLHGYAVDAGLTRLFDGAYRPHITVAFAQGSGDGDPSDGVDRNFRQTGIQDNDDRFGGVTSFRYYGEVLDPELSNLRIITLGAGFRPSRKSSVDLVWHHYQQVELSAEMRDIALPDPNGMSRDLGQSVDLILGYREIRNLKLELMLGWFFPAKAFSPLSDTAFFIGSEMRFKF